MAVEYKNEVFVTDLVRPFCSLVVVALKQENQGGDKIWRIGDTGAPGDFSIHGFIEHPKGTGPRHMAILGMYLAVLSASSS